MISMAQAQAQKSGQIQGNNAAKRRKIGLLGDSNFNRINAREMSGFLENGYVAKYSYSGATSLHLGHYSDVLLDEQPDQVIIHVGTNDIVGRSRSDISCHEIATNFIDIGGKCRS